MLTTTSVSGRVSAAQPVEDLRDFVAGDIPDDQRHQSEIAEHDLEKGLVHLEAVLARVGRIDRDDLRQREHGCECSSVDADQA